MSVFEKYPDFINRDPRIDRTHSFGNPTYSVNVDFMEKRHNCLFDFDISGKTVLDLGCCVAGTGAYVLDKNAKFYQGVEIHHDLAAIASENLNVFDSDRWNISNSSLDVFLSQNTQKFDVVIASGVVYTYFDPIPFMTKLTELADIIILESRHPKRFTDDATVEYIENTPLISFSELQPMMDGLTKKELIYHGSQVGYGFARYFFDIYGFYEDRSCYEKLKELIPEFYQSHRTKRFGARFLRGEIKEQYLGFTEKFKSHHGLEIR